MASNKRPNILFFFTDDQRFDTIGALGNPRIQTPTLDGLVDRGTAFTHAHAMGGSCPAVCMPSRAMLMTGRPLYRLDGWGETVPHDHALLPETLRRAGYNTFGTGKWHNGTDAYARSFNSGEHIFFGGMGDHWNVPACRFDPSGKYEQRAMITLDYRRQAARERVFDHIEAGKHSSELFADAAIDYLRAYNDGAPFMMYVSFMAPHDPRTMPRAYLDMYDPQTIDLPANFMPAHPFDNGELRIRDEKLAAFPRGPNEVRRHIAAYYAMITHADAQIGRVLRVLDEAGHAENTIVVFAGDNGLAVGRHGLMGKQNLYDHSVRVPLIFSGPGIEQNARRSALAYLSDIFPTLCDLAEAPVPDSVEGTSLVPALNAPNASVRESVFLAYRHVQRGIRDTRYKLIEYAVDGRRTTQLFDLLEDPDELNNLADAPGHAHTVTRLREQLRGWREAAGDHTDQGNAFWQACD